MRGRLLLLLPLLALHFPQIMHAKDWEFRLRRIQQVEGQETAERRESLATWAPRETAIIVCDVWDYHHCLNAVRRLEEFAPRLDQLLKEARRQGATIIHSPSDCMEAYAEHPARQRAMAVPKAAVLPRGIEHWCSRIPSEQDAIYPLDQADGGEDDDPAEHAAWAAKLKGLGRNPAMPWKKQSPLITIDQDRDFISDKGDEVWSILEAKGIHHVILAGVHTNMCVLGRPFGLRQMARNSKQVVLMRDLTDCMYNPARWPYVDHFTGNDLLVAYVERYVCPTITSDQLLGGSAFQFKNDNRAKREIATVHGDRTSTADPAKRWILAEVPVPAGHLSASSGRQPTGWYRCAIWLSSDWLGGRPLSLDLGKQAGAKAWLNGKPFVAQPEGKGMVFESPSDVLLLDDANLLVVRLDANGGGELAEPPILVAGNQKFALRGRWQMRWGDDASWSSIPLPAKFGAPPDILFEPHVSK